MPCVGCELIDKLTTSPRGLGEPFDLLNAGIYALQGDFANAGWSLGSALPFVGYGATVGKYTQRGLGAITSRSIMSYNELGKITKGTGLQRHHLLEQRFKDVMDTDLAKKAIALTKEEHQYFTNKWREAFSYGNGTKSASYDSVMNEAKTIYKNYPNILKALGL